jgi:hypothetical protein
VKWGGVVVCVALTGVWVTSIWWTVGWEGLHSCILIHHGCLTAWWEKGASSDWKELMFIRPQVRDAALVLRPSIQIDNRDTIVTIPFWVVAAAGAVPTAAAWRFDAFARRRARTGHCPACNYDRTGIPDASPCPECGTGPVPTVGEKGQGARS